MNCNGDHIGRLSDVPCLQASPARRAVGKLAMANFACHGRSGTGSAPPRPFGVSDIRPLRITQMGAYQRQSKSWPWPTLSSQVLQKRKLTSRTSGLFPIQIMQMDHPATNPVGWKQPRKLSWAFSASMTPRFTLWRRFFGHADGRSPAAIEKLAMANFAAFCISLPCDQQFPARRKPASMASASVSKGLRFCAPTRE